VATAGERLAGIIDLPLVPRQGLELGLI
jgi:hypothetical protein